MIRYGIDENNTFDEFRKNNNFECSFKLIDKNNNHVFVCTSKCLKKMSKVFILSLIGEKQLLNFTQKESFLSEILNSDSTYRKPYILQMNKSRDCNSSKYLPSPISSNVISPRPDQSNEEQVKNANIYNKLLEFLSTQHISLLKKKLLEFRGTHNPISYKQSFNFQERWQKATKINQQVNFNLLMSSSQISYVFSFLMMIHNFILIWFLSVFRLYEVTKAEPFFQLGIIFVTGDIILKIYHYVEHYKANNQTLKFNKILFNWDFLALVIGDLWCIIYFICIISKTQLANIHLNGMLPFDILTVIFLARRCYEIYNYMLILLVATKYKNEMTIFDLVVKMLLILHFFVIFTLFQSMLLYGVAMTSPEDNWMARIQMEDNLWSTKYIYTLYFACTTMFTVGYGDILPTNKVQIITIMIIEALGMALFGYIVNEVGAALGNMRKRRANFQKDIYNAQRISRYYELSSDLGKKVRDYVISNQIAQQQLGINEQNDFLLKLNEELRNQVKQSHQLKIIKTSIFFISHWSKKIQIQMAKRLQKCIFAPNESIHSKGQVDRLYVMVKGRIQVFTQKKFGTKICCRKLLKIIEKTPGQQVFNNVFGFTSFFAGKANRLKAIAKDSTVCYTLGYEDISDSINEDSNDFEYFHYLRQKFQFSKIPQKWQTPNIVNIRQNYSPVIFYIIKKHTKLCKTQSRRKSWNRRDYMNRRVCQLNFGKNQSQSYHAQSYQSESSQSQKSNQSQLPSRQQVDPEQVEKVSFDKSDQIICQTPIWKKTQACIQQLSNSNQIISNRSYRRKYWYAQRQQRYEEKVKQFSQQFIQLTSEFEIGKNYNRFFPKFNKKTVVQHIMKKPQMIRKEYGKNSKQLSKSYQSNLKRTIKRNFSQIFHDDIFIN